MSQRNAPVTGLSREMSDMKARKQSKATAAGSSFDNWLAEQGDAFKARLLPVP